MQGHQEVQVAGGLVSEGSVFSGSAVFGKEHHSFRNCFSLSREQEVAWTLWFLLCHVIFHLQDGELLSPGPVSIPWNSPPHEKHWYWRESENPEENLLVTDPSVLLYTPSHLGNILFLNIMHSICTTWGISWAGENMCITLASKFILVTSSIWKSWRRWTCTYPRTKEVNYSEFEINLLYIAYSQDYLVRACLKKRREGEKENNTITPNTFQKHI